MPILSCLGEQQVIGERPPVKPEADFTLNPYLDRLIS